MNNTQFCGDKRTISRSWRRLGRAAGAGVLALNLAAGATWLRADDLVPLKPELPTPTFVGTPKEAPAGATDIENPSEKHPPLMIPKDAKNIAPGSTITTSDQNAKADALAKITDGDKEARDSSIVLLRKGLQWVQFDLGAPKEIFAIVIWHAHDAPKVYRQVVAQVADDPDFKTNVRTLFNNDKSNTAGLGAGTDRQYYETNAGKQIDGKGEKARYVRLYSHGSTDSALNEYTEVEIYGRPVK